MACPGSWKEREAWEEANPGNDNDPEEWACFSADKWVVLMRSESQVFA